MLLSKAIEVFTKFKEKELSARTLEEYKSDLKLFLKVVGDREVELIRTADIMLFRTSLECSPSLINRRLSALSTFFNFLVDMEVIKTNPVKPSLRIKKVKQKVPDALTSEEIKKVLEAARKRSERDYLIFKTILDTGLRISELLSLRTENFTQVKGRPVLRVVGKGGKERFIPITEELSEKLLRLAEENGGRVFPLTYYGVRYIFKQVSQDAGVKVHPHKLRHTFATNLVDMGVDIRVIQAFLGHASPSTSARYAKVRDDVMFKVVDELISRN